MPAQKIAEILETGCSGAIADDAAPNFDPLARIYRWMEYLSFGPMLERCRFHFLTQCMRARHALILGDGDGRFTARFLRTNQTAHADAVDASAAMLAALHRRACPGNPEAGARLRTVHTDLRGWTPSGAGYDLVVSHFFLDCLTDDDVEKLIARTIPHLSANATWLVSEFAIPEGRWRSAGARLLIRVLYFAFARMTRLRVKGLPDYATALSRHGFHCREQHRFLNGLLVSEMWTRDRHLERDNANFCA